MITSTSNQQIKNLITLQTKASERRKQGLLVVEGERIVREIPSERLEKIYISESFLEMHKDAGHSMIRTILGDAKPEHMPATEVLSDAVFRAVSDTDTPQGILALVRIQSSSLEEILSLVNTQSLYVVLDRLQDPGNLGTILRSAEGAGASAILMSKDTVDCYNPKVVRSTMGSLFRVPFCYVEDLTEAIARLKERGVRVYAGHLKGEHNFYEEDYRSASAFLIGNEGNGLREEVAATADTYVRIPMLGQLESLNAAVCASLMMYEALRQRQ